MGIPLYMYDKIDSGECINCFKCIPSCPRKNISVNIAESDIRSVAAGALTVTFLTGMYYTTSSLTANDAGAYAGSSAAVTDTTKNSSNKYADGTYEGSGTGFRRGTTTVSVTVKDDAITDIEIISTDDDAKWFNRAYRSVVSQILDKQSTDVDAVSGATYSSMGIMNAVEDALSNAAL